MSQPTPDHIKVPETKQSTTSVKSESTQPPTHSADYASYLKLDPTDVTPPPENWENISMGSQHQPNPGSAPVSTSAATSMPAESNPYVSPAPVQSSAVKMKTGPSFADAAVGRIAQGTKALAEGGYEKIFQQTFENVPGEKLLKSYACYLSTLAGSVMGVLYLSTVKITFCSDNPLSYQVGDQTQWSYYKVVLPLRQLRAVNPSASRANPSEKYIQVISVDNHEFWFMGFVHYDSAIINLQGALQPHSP